MLMRTWYSAAAEAFRNLIARSQLIIDAWPVCAHTCADTKGGAYTAYLETGRAYD